MSSLFDVYLAVDWSARSVPSPARPSRDALWVAEVCAPGVGEPGIVSETYWRTRQACLAHLRTRLLWHASRGRRVLLGCDFCYGFPAGYAAAPGLSGDAPPWRRLWQELSRLVRDDASNANNRFEVAALLNARCGGMAPGPLWGCPASLNLPMLPATSPNFPYLTRSGAALQRLRLAERQARGAQPVWKLAGSGSVGGQTLLGIPAICRLRDDPELTAISRVWPFETGFTSTPTPVAGPWILHAEIYPGLLADALDPTLAIRDQAQVRAVARWLRDLDADGRLGARFAAPPELSAESLALCVQEEGWILGAGRARAPGLFPR